MSHNIIAKLHEMAAEHPNRLAIVMKSTEITFGELSQHVKQASQGLKSKGISSGNAVVVMVPMSIDLYIAMLAIIQIGAVCVFFDPWLKGETISHIVNLVKPRAYVGNWKSALLKFSRKVLRDIPVGIYSIKKLLRHEACDDIFPAEKTSPALITFSSGSSGIPKGANRTHGFLLAQHEALKQSFPAQPVSMNMFPIFALNNLGCGVTSIIPDMDFKNVSKIDVKIIAQQINHHQVTSCTASPPFFDQLATVEGLQLTQIITGGGAVTDEQLRRWLDAFPGAEIIVAYGSTEAEPVAHITAKARLSAVPEHPGYCMGKPIAQIKAKVINITNDIVDRLDDVELDQGEIGELVVAGEHVCKNYYQNDAATRENKILDGDTVWHRMGDTGYFDDTGRFWLVGRVHSTIKQGKQLIHPQQVEYLIKNQFEQVKKVAILTFKDQLILVTDTEIPEDSATQRLSEHNIYIDKVMTYRKTFPVDPRHNTKIDYAKLAAQIEAKI